MSDEKPQGEPVPAKAKDGSFLITVSPDKLEATIEVVPHGEGGQPVRPDQIMGKIKELGISGVELPGIDNFLKAGNFGGPMVLCRGRAAEKGEDGRVEHLFLEKNKEKRGEDAQGRVDHHEVSSFIFAKDGELLSRKIPPIPGKDGQTVTGEIIPAPPSTDAPISAGQNIRVSENGLEFFAAASGVVVQQGNGISVDKVLMQEGDVDFDVGNIDFDGSVCVKGTINEGFTVKATGDVMAATVSKAQINAGRNVVIEKGIIGSPDTTVKAKGDVTAKFVENANVQAGGNIVVSEIVLHSNISAGKNVVLRGGKHASIVGGHVRAAGSIEARTIGADAASKTHIEIGLDPAVRDRLDAFQKELSAAKEKNDKAMQEIASLVKLKERMRNKLSPEKEARLTVLKSESAAAAKQIHALESQLAPLLQQFGSAKPGFVSVKEKIFRGTHIAILDQSITVDKEQGSTRYYFNRDKKQILNSDFKEIEL